MPHFQNGSSCDFLSRSTALRNAGVARVDFNPSNEVHCASLKTFIETGVWGGVQFYAEYPFIDVPMTVLMKFAGIHLNAQRESDQTRSARLATKKLIAAVASESEAEHGARLAKINERIRSDLTGKNVVDRLAVALEQRNAGDSQPAE